MNPDWILVKGSNPEAIRAAVIAHSEVARHELPARFRVSVYALGDDRHAVAFDSPIPPYDLTNLINWLDDAKMCAGSGGAVGWLMSPASGVRYFLAPKPGKAGDTLLGIGTDGKRVEVFLPDCSVSFARHKLTPTPEPAVALTELTPAVVFEVSLDANPDFGNPEFDVV